jgi:putative transposase
MQTTMSKGLVIAALQMALQSRHPAKGLLHHSDQGSQYASQEYQQLLHKAGMIPSMSRKGNCYDKAPMESFFASLKRELIYYRRYYCRSQAKQDIFQYIETCGAARRYNCKRRHSSLGYLSPEAFEKPGNRCQVLLNSLSVKVGKPIAYSCLPFLTLYRPFPHTVLVMD